MADSNGQRFITHLCPTLPHRNSYGGILKWLRLDRKMTRLELYKMVLIFDEIQYKKRSFNEEELVDISDEALAEAYLDLKNVSPEELINARDDYVFRPPYKKNRLIGFYAKDYDIGELVVDVGIGLGGRCC